MKILVVDDEKNIRHTLGITLKTWGHDIVLQSSVEDAIKVLKSESFDILLTDFKLNGNTGLDLLRFLKGLASPPIAIVMTAYASFENAVNAIKEGAYDYLPKPFSNSQLEHLLNKISQVVLLKKEITQLKSGSARQDYFQGLTSPAMNRLEDFVCKVAPTEAGVLITGESGTGKTELARLIHLRSARAQKPFVVVNCTTLTESLIESELFGHIKGAFTGAIQDRIGKLEMANHGTVLIDEVGDLSLTGQTKLLRFLQEKVIERVGGNKSIHLDVRVIAATNKNLEEAVQERKFREDLFFRLNIFECQTVPLRHRKEDIPVLLKKLMKESQSPSQEFPETILKLLVDYPWPGNVRELRNTVERILLLSQGREIQTSDLPDSILRNPWKKTSDSHSVFRTLEELEKEQIEKVLQVEERQERAAEILGITTVTLWRKRKQYGLS